MKRRKWLLAFLGIGAASAQSPKPKSDPPWRGCLTPQWSATCKKTNGQCPVCATQAEPYRPAYTLDDCKPIGEEAVGCEEEPEPRVKLVRCENCNAAFWQDMEKKEKL